MQSVDSLKQKRTYLKRKSTNIERKEQQRIERHQKLIQMVHEYTRTQQQQQRLKRIRKNTLFEIDIRYSKNNQNKQYTFPRKQVSNDKNDQFPLNNLGGSVLYNLYSQNVIPKKAKEGLKNESGRRLKSLDQREYQNDSKEKIINNYIRIVRKVEHSLEQKTPKMKRALTQPKSLKLKPLIFPEIKKKNPNIKTEQSTNKQMQYDYNLSKKLITEQNSPLSISPSRIMKR